MITQEVGQFDLTGRGRSNTFSLFAELCWRLARADGRVGLVVPSGVVTDDTTKLFFQELVATNSLVSVFDFENRLPLFPDIDSRTKFCLITIKGQEFLRFFETSGAFRMQQQGSVIEAVTGAPLPSGVLVDTETEVVAGLLLKIASTTLERQTSADQANSVPSSAKRA